jgi:hypothetical protein
MNLIERLERATGPDRGLDLEIAIAVHGRPGVLVMVQDEAGNIHEHTHWEYTASIDAALTIWPKGWEWALQSDSGTFRVEFGDPSKGWGSEHDCAAVAMCIAGLRARELAKDEAA